MGGRIPVVQIDPFREAMEGFDVHADRHAVWVLRLQSGVLLAMRLKPYGACQTKRIFPWRASVFSANGDKKQKADAVSYTHLRAHETEADL
eukprot:3623661-Rhodomonas_salina.1